MRKLSPGTLIVRNDMLLREQREKFTPLTRKIGSPGFLLSALDDCGNYRVLDSDGCVDVWSERYFDIVETDNAR
jgi:hypothetical protein